VHWVGVPKEVRARRLKKRGWMCLRNCARASSGVLRIRPLDGGAVLHAEAKPGAVVRPGDTWGEYAMVMRTNAVTEIPLWFCSSQLRFLL
jgi:hypothetical protein